MNLAGARACKVKYATDNIKGKTILSIDSTYDGTLLELFTVFSLLNLIYFLVDSYGPLFGP